MVKNLIYEIVKLKEEDIWYSYTVVENHRSPDNHIKKYIKITLKSLKPKDKEEPVKRVVEYEFKMIITDYLRNPTHYDQGIVKLEKFIKNNPNYDYKEKLDA